VLFIGLKYVTVMAVGIQIIVGNLLTSWAAFSFSNKTVFYAVTLCNSGSWLVATCISTDFWN